MGHIFITMLYHTMLYHTMLYHTMLYHLVPLDLRGDVLYPLNTLKVKHPEIYSSLIPKYDGRKQILDQRIPLLECLWNDVLHLSPIHPLRLKDAHIKAGLSWKTQSFFEIDPEDVGITAATR